MQDACGWRCAHWARACEARSACERGVVSARGCGVTSTPARRGRWSHWSLPSLQQKQGRRCALSGAGSEVPVVKWTARMYRALVRLGGDSASGDWQAGRGSGVTDWVKRRLTLRRAGGRVGP
jgi:hypothetical protein